MSGVPVGTPLYMSPEQAAGHNDELDDRSDVYALCVVLYEWLTLEHPRKRTGTLIETLAAAISQDYDARDLIARSSAANVPVEYVHVILRGLARDRNQRFQDVGELEAALERARDGFIPVQCAVTAGKHVVYATAHWIDRHPRTFVALLYGAATGVLGGLGVALWHGVKAAM